MDNLKLQPIYTTPQKRHNEPTYGQLRSGISEYKSANRHVDIISPAAPHFRKVNIILFPNSNVFVEKVIPSLRGGNLERQLHCELGGFHIKHGLLSYNNLNIQ